MVGAEEAEAEEEEEEVVEEKKDTDVKSRKKLLEPVDLVHSGKWS